MRRFPLLLTSLLILSMLLGACTVADEAAGTDADDDR